MKKIILGSVMAIAAASSFNAHATLGTQSICSGGAATAGAAVVSATDAFVKVNFSPKCSANIHLVTDDGGTYYRAGAGSAKGKSYFGGSTAGGAISAAGTCAATGCVSADAVSGYTAAASS